jgi:uncharacterized protein (DUF488 family)
MVLGGVPIPIPVLTVGHSTRDALEFSELLRAHDVEGIADVRRFPASRRHPHFSSEALATALAADGVAYRHFPELGGRRTARADSINTAWQHPAFRAYADYMETTEFVLGVEALLQFAEGRRVAVMCAEAQWWRCHRRLIADALVARGIEVQHIMSPTKAPRHELTSFARLEGINVRYPGAP